jgi:hypothetical protein
MAQTHCSTVGLQKASQHGWMSWLLPSTRGEFQQQVSSGMQLRLQLIVQIFTYMWRPAEAA